MNQLVILVGLPGSGKTAFQRERPDWVVVSKSSIRQAMFRCSYDPSHEPTVDRVFAASLVEALDSPSAIVCVDEPNLRRADRARLIELADAFERQAMAYVMAPASPDALFERLQRNLRRLALEQPHLRVCPFPRREFDVLVEQVEPAGDDEGFAEVVLADPPAGWPRTAPARKTPSAHDARQALPLFAP